MNRSNPFLDSTGHLPLCGSTCVLRFILDTGGWIRTAEDTKARGGEFLAVSPAKLRTVPQTRVVKYPINDQRRSDPLPYACQAEAFFFDTVRLEAGPPIPDLEPNMCAFLDEPDLGLVAVALQPFTSAIIYTERPGPTRFRRGLVRPSQTRLQASRRTTGLANCRLNLAGFVHSV